MHWEKAIRQLCQARVEVLSGWLLEENRYLLICLGLLTIGGAVYGASIGIWRDPLQALYVAIKFPLLLGLTALGNALINGMLAQLLGAQISFRQSLLAVLMSYALLSVILGAFAPLSWFLVWHLPAIGTISQNLGYDLYLLTNVVLIICAGVIANTQLYRLLIYICQDTLKARKILIAWFVVNLFLGAQLSWNLRPFFGTPKLLVKFLRDNPFDGSFYEAVFYIIINRLGA